MNVVTRTGAISALLLTAACSLPAQVPVVDGTSLAQVGAKQPGRYAAFVQTGGWSLKAERNGIQCWTSDYTVDVNPTWEKTAKEAVIGAIDKVEFLEAVKSPEELKRDGYDGMVILTQSNAKTDMSIAPKFFTAEAIAETALEVVMVVNWPDGKTLQDAFVGRGRGVKEVFTCIGPEEAVGQSAGVAIGALVRQMIVTLKLHLAQHKT